MKHILFCLAGFFWVPTLALSDSCDQEQLSGSTSKRISNTEFRNSLLSLFSPYVKSDRMQEIFKRLPEDRLRGGDVFDHMKQSLSFELIQGYALVAEDISAELVARDDWFDAVLGKSYCKYSLTQECMENFFWNFARPLIRRQLNDAEKSSYYRFIERDRNNIKANVIMMSRMLLQSSLFIYRLEMDGEEKGQGLRSLSENELAARLAAFLWRSSPDKQLLDRAWQGTLRSSWNEEVDRMMEAPQFAAMLGHFYSSWLNLDFIPAANYGAAFLDGLAVDRDSYQAELSRDLLGFAQRLTKENYYFADLMSSTLVQADTDFLAKLYRVDRRDGFQEIEHRNGILTRPGFLANGLDYASIVKRGAFINNRILCRDIPPPPDPSVIANAPKPDPRKSSRQQLEARTGQGFCASCHSKLNPPGFVLENFDAIGRFRLLERVIIDGKLIEHPIDSSLKSANVDSSSDPEVGNLADYSQILAQSRTASECFAEQWFKYAFARKPEPTERCLIEDFSLGLRNRQLTLKQLIREMTRHPFFHYTRAK